MIGVLIITSVALLLSILLVIIDKLTSEKYSSKEYLEKLPGYNCGTCGYAGCAGMADALLTDKEAYKKCRLLKGDKLKELEELLK